MKVKYPRKTVTIITLIAVCQPLVVVSPAHAFWFFHHNKKDESQTTLNKQNDYPDSSSSDNQIEPTAIRSHSKGRRLLPAGFINPSIPPKKQTDNSLNGSVQSQANTPGKAINSNNQNFYNQNSDAVPIKTTSIYTTTEIKIGIGLNLRIARIAILDGAQLIDNASGETIANLPAQSDWRLSTEDNNIVLQPAKDHFLALQQLAKSYSIDNGIKPAAYTTTIDPTRAKKDRNVSSSAWSTNMDSLSMPGTNSTYTIKAVSGTSGQGLLALNDRLYRGSFLIKQINTQNSKTGLAVCAFNIINCLDLEDYLLSVVPSEMPSLWPAEALKAQAIAARSYAVANLGKHGSQGYDLKDNTEDQMYLGVRSETEQTNEAINSTRGLVLKYDGKPICAYFHSSSGGGTEAAENVWQKPLPYLKAVADFDQEAPLYTWTKNYSVTQTESGFPKDIGQILSIAVLAKSPSGRPTHLLVNGSNNSRIISGEAARKYFSLPSANFNVTPAETAYIFNGKGFGHGLGLSQWGARSLAKHGYNAAQILCYYYNGISIDY